MIFDRPALCIGREENVLGFRFSVDGRPCGAGRGGTDCWGLGGGSRSGVGRGVIWCCGCVEALEWMSEWMVRSARKKTARRAVFSKPFGRLRKTGLEPAWDLTPTSS